MSTKPELKLIGEKELLETIWPDPKTRPSHRTLTAWRLSGRIPYVRIGGRDYVQTRPGKKPKRGNSGQVWYELEAVKGAIADKWTVAKRARASQARRETATPAATPEPAAEHEPEPGAQAKDYCKGKWMFTSAKQK